MSGMPRLAALMVFRPWRSRGRRWPPRRRWGRSSRAGAGVDGLCVIQWKRPMPTEVARLKLETCGRIGIASSRMPGPAVRGRRWAAPSRRSAARRPGRSPSGCPRPPGPARRAGLRAARGRRVGPPRWAKRRPAPARTTLGCQGSMSPVVITPVAPKPAAGESDHCADVAEVSRAGCPGRPRGRAGACRAGRRGPRRRSAGSPARRRRWGAGASPARAGLWRGPPRRRP